MGKRTQADYFRTNNDPAGNVIRRKQAQRIHLEGPGGITDPDGWQQHHWGWERPAPPLVLLQPTLLTLADLFSSEEERTHLRQEATAKITRLLECIPAYYGLIIRDMVATTGTIQAEVAKRDGVSQASIAARRIRAVEAARWASNHWPMHSPSEVLTTLLNVGVTREKAWLLAWGWGTWVLSRCPLDWTPGKVRYLCEKAAAGGVPREGKNLIPKHLRPGFYALAYPRETGRPVPTPRGWGVQPDGFPEWLPHPDTLKE